MNRLAERIPGLTLCGAFISFGNLMTKELAVPGWAALWRAIWQTGQYNGLVRPTGVACATADL
ncbi:MAG: hypothetical protein DMG22_04335 [Acidobacteria bacterium]|nr:MAG: hypothetical protein DMG22_04335 [Acidobacteriota bacterium]